MYAVVVNLTINDSDAAEKALHEQLVPRVSQAPGFVAGYWTTKEDDALSFFVFDTEENAKAMPGRPRPAFLPASPWRESRCCEVAAHADGRLLARTRAERCGLVRPSRSAVRDRQRAARAGVSCRRSGRRVAGPDQQADLVHPSRRPVRRAHEIDDRGAVSSRELALTIPRHSSS